MAKVKPEDIVEDTGASGEEEEEEDEEVYYVEKIVNHRKEKDGTMEYMIKWEGYPTSENTWETEENVIDQDLLKKYWGEIEKKKASRAGAKKSNGRVAESMDASPPPATKRQRSKNSVKRTSEVGLVEGMPEEATADAESWEAFAEDIETVDRGEDGSLVVSVRWKNGSVTEHPAPDVYDKLTMLMFRFYEDRLRFRTAK